jgi:hypothetical protein
MRFRPRETIAPDSSVTIAPTGIVPASYASHISSKTVSQGGAGTR